MEELARDTGIGKGSIIDFSANINPLGYPYGIKGKIMESFDSVLNYPDIDSHELVRSLASYHGLAPENILIGNGSTEFIYWLPLLLRPKRALIVTPAFSEYEKGLRLAGTEISFFETRRDEDFRIDTTLLARRLGDRLDTLYLGNPANPSGVLTDRKAVLDIIAMTEKERIMAVIDEAFIDFTEDISVKNIAANSGNVVVMRSMTKFFGIPGLRLGYIIANKSIIEQIRRDKPPWTVNALTQSAAGEALRDVNFIEKSRAYVETERAFLQKRLSAIEGLTVTQGAANYLLVHMSDTLPFNAPTLRTQLLDSGIAIRDCSNYRGLDKYYFRVAVKKREENLILIDKLRHLLI